MHTCTPTLTPACAQTSMFVHAKKQGEEGGKGAEKERQKRGKQGRMEGGIEGNNCVVLVGNLHLFGRYHNFDFYTVFKFYGFLLKIMIVNASAV